MTESKSVYIRETPDEHGNSYALLLSEAEMKAFIAIMGAFSGARLKEHLEHNDRGSFERLQDLFTGLTTASGVPSVGDVNYHIWAKFFSDEYDTLCALAREQGKDHWLS